MEETINGPATAAQQGSPTASPGRVGLARRPDFPGSPGGYIGASSSFDSVYLCFLPEGARRFPSAEAAVRWLGSASFAGHACRAADFCPVDLETGLEVELETIPIDGGPVAPCQSPACQLCESPGLPEGALMEVRLDPDVAMIEVGPGTEDGRLSAADARLIEEAIAVAEGWLDLGQRSGVRAALAKARGILRRVAGGAGEGGP